jgi:hypothetical protein
MPGFSKEQRCLSEPRCLNRAGLSLWNRAVCMSRAVSGSQVFTTELSCLYRAGLSLLSWAVSMEPECLYGVFVSRAVNSEPDCVFGARCLYSPNSPTPPFAFNPQKIKNT